MIKEGIEKVLELAKVESFEDPYGRKYWSKPLTAAAPALPKTLHLHTLEGLVDLVEAEDLKECMAIIGGPFVVELVGQRDKAWQNRSIYAQAEAFPCDFRFNSYMDIENFIIQVQRFFVEDKVKKDIIDAVSKVTGESVVIAEDDGAAQQVTKKDGIGRKEKAKMNPMVELAPWRTFREIEQPKDKYLLRFSKNEPGCLPNVALFTAGGDLWQLEAVERIHKYLTEKLPKDVAVIR